MFIGAKTWTTEFLFPSECLEYWLLNTAAVIGQVSYQGWNSSGKSCYEVLTCTVSLQWSSKAKNAHLTLHDCSVKHQWKFKIVLNFWKKTSVVIWNAESLCFLSWKLMSKIFYKELARYFIKKEKSTNGKFFSRLNLKAQGRPLSIAGN